LTIRAQCFYLARKKNIVIHFDDYKRYLLCKSLNTEPTPDQAEENDMARRQTSSGSGSMSATVFAPKSIETSQSDIHHTSHHHYETELPLESKTAPYPSSFAEIVELITSGATIPGIRDIPNTLLTDQATICTVPKRRKPWEKEVPENVIVGKEGGVVGGTFGDHRDNLILQELPEE